MARIRSFGRHITLDCQCSYSIMRVADTRGLCLLNICILLLMNTHFVHSSFCLTLLLGRMFVQTTNFYS